MTERVDVVILTVDRNAGFFQHRIDPFGQPCACFGVAEVKKRRGNLPLRLSGKEGILGDPLRLKPQKRLASVLFDMGRNVAHFAREAVGIDLPAAGLRPVVDQLVISLEVPAGVHPPVIGLYAVFTVNVERGYLICIGCVTHFRVYP